MKQLSIVVDVSSRRVTRAIALAALLNAAFMAGSAAFVYLWPQRAALPPLAQGLLEHVGAQFHLGVENVVATWYSSMLLLTGAVLAALCLAADRQGARRRRDRLLAWGWGAFATIFLTLSADEIGSIHERLGMLEQMNLFGDRAPGWVIALAMPIGLTGLFMMAFALLRVRRSPLGACLVILGVGLLLTVPLQEYTEDLWIAEWIAQDPSHTDSNYPRSPYSLLLEEGVAELFGVLCIVAALAVYLLRASHVGGTPGALTFHPTPKGVWAPAFAALASGAALHGAIRRLGVNAMTGDSGIPENWVPAAAGWMAALVALQIRALLPPERSGERRLYAATAAIAVTMSAYCGAALYYYRSWGSFEALRMLLEGGFLVCAVSIAFGLPTRARNRWMQAAGAGWAGVLVAGMAVHGDAPLVAFTAAGLLLLSLVGHVQQVRHVGFDAGGSAREVRDGRLSGIHGPARAEG
jgi:hypothetical protein